MEKTELVNLVRAVQNGEADAAGRLYDAFQPDIYYYIRKTVNDSVLAEDLTQDTFIEILQTIDKLQEPAAFVTWSRQIAYHRCTAHFRKRKELLADEDEDGYSVFDTMEEDRTEFIPHEALDREDLKQTIHAMIDSLPEEQRSAIMMRYFDELPVKQIAQIQGVSEGTVKSRLNYGRKAIQESVETYEKKNNVKLHCVGIVPLLLWLFREYRLANGISLTAGAAAAAAGTAATAGAGTGAAVAATGVGTKATAGLIAKIVAGIAAAALVAGGTITLLHQEPEPTIAPTSEVTQAPTEEVEYFEWSGYGKDVGGHIRKRFEITVDQMDDDSIQGHMAVSTLYDVLHETDFTGTGTKNEDGTITYQLTLQVPAHIGIYDYYELPLTFDPETEALTLAEHYSAVLQRKTANPEITVFAEDATWSGSGECSFCWPNTEEHSFQIQVAQMTQTEIHGTLTVHNDRENVTEHVSRFTGRGFADGSRVYFEIALETPRSMPNIGQDLVIDYFWLVYDTQTDTLTAGAADAYAYELQRNT